MKTVFSILSVTVLFLCLSCQNATAPQISEGSEVVALRGDSYRQGRAFAAGSSSWLVRWKDGYAPRRYRASELALLGENAAQIERGSFGLCRTVDSGRWWICRVDETASDRLRVKLLEDNTESSISPSDFIRPAAAQQKDFVRRSAALLRSEAERVHEIKAEYPPAGIGLPVLYNQTVLLKRADGEFLRGICARQDASTVFVNLFSAQDTISASVDEVAPVYGMEFDRSRYRESVRAGDVVYASPDGARFLPARVESVLEEGRFIRVLFADLLKMRLDEEFWLPQSEKPTE